MRDLWKVIKQNSNARIFLIFSMLNSLWFIEAIWYFYWGKFLSYTEVGLAFALLVIVGMVAEVPTGYFADRYGRKNSVVLGAIILSLGGIISATCINGLMLVVGTSIMTVGRAFISGALEALTYDSLKLDKLEKYYDKLISLKFQLSLIAYIIAVPVGGFVYNFYFRLPNILETTALLVTIWVATRLVEVKPVKASTDQPSVRELAIGFKELIAPNLRKFIIPSILIVTTFELYDWGLSKPAMALNFGLDPRGQSLVYTLLAISNVITVGMVPRLRKLLGDYWGLRLVTLIPGIAFIISTYSLGLYGISILWLIETSGNLGDPWSSAVINEHVGSRYRATTLSTLAFLTRIPHLVVNIWAGSAIDGMGINTFHYALGVIIVIITALTIYPTHRTKSA